MYVIFQVYIGWLGFAAVASGCLAAVVFGRSVFYLVVCLNFCWI